MKVAERNREEPSRLKEERLLVSPARVFTSSSIWKHLKLLLLLPVQLHRLQPHRAEENFLVLTG